MEARFTLGLKGVSNPAAGIFPGSRIMRSERRNMPEQELSIKEREQELYDEPQEISSDGPPVKPFPIYLKETPAVPMSRRREGHALDHRHRDLAPPDRRALAGAAIRPDRPSLRRHLEPAR